MDRLEEGRKLAVGIELGAGRNADCATTSRTEVAEDVAEEVPGHDDVEEIGPLHEISGQDVDVEFVHMEPRCPWARQGQRFRA